MSDLAITWDGEVADLAISGFDFVLDHELVTPTLIALFTDRRAAVTDEIPDGTQDRRGWWGDSFAAPGRLIGSRLWLLERCKDVSDVPLRAKEYAREGLAELLATGRVTAVQVGATVPRKGLLYLQAQLQQPDLDPYEFTQELEI